MRNLLVCELNNDTIGRMYAVRCRIIANYGFGGRITMKKPWSRSQEHIDKGKINARKQAKEDLRALLACGDEERYIALIKALRPNLKPEELVSLVRRFREERRNQSRGN